MARKNFSQVLAFINVVREGSFTRAAALLGVTPSALSHAISGLEAQVGVQLLTRTTRSISTTEAGERLFLNVSTRLEEIDAELGVVDALRDKPVGTVRITSAEHAANSYLWPKLSKILGEYPDIDVEITIDYQMADIVSQRYDAGVRMGNQVAKDMIAVRIGPDMRIAVVGSPDYFGKRTMPRTPHDLAQHNCINLRLPTHGGLMPWDFDKDGQQVKLRVTGQWVFNNSSSIVRAALAGHGLAFVPEDMVLEHIAEGRLIRLLDDWCAPYPGYHLYYPNRREFSPALSIIIDALRYQE
ncbi:LysR family transcriptional regulator [Acerihabitans arboris]|uniref:LysR family transcriptional regulator n=1 Tax=Acerihabitans arboris TaxID=2691583 RepID=A0A845SF99_9GAMM|nr:LysR family transcriptional regulator [Acerihabitans arboris]NDL62027.1 LysR family transcriptional regulator [Acerihabitans arboris]